MALYVMHCPSLMTVVSASEGFVPFTQWLESSSWLQYYMFYIQKAILNGGNYQLGRCFFEVHDAPTGTSLQTALAQMDSPDYFLASSSG